MGSTAFAQQNLNKALVAAQDVAHRGFTFVDGQGNDTFVSFSELAGDVERRAAKLATYGIKAGDRVALVVVEGREFISNFLAAIWLGAVPVPLYPPASLGKLDNYQDTLVSILNKAEPTVVCASEQVKMAVWSSVARLGFHPRMISADELRDAPAARLPPHELTDEGPAFLQFTSGSTSTPKGVVVTHGSLRANARSIIEHGLKVTPDDLGVSWLPLYHDMGLIGFVLAPLLYQVQIAFLSTTAFVKNATLWLETIHRKRGTLTFAPNFAYALAAKRSRQEQIQRWDLSCVRVWGCGAEPISADNMRHFVKTLSPTGVTEAALAPSYGMAEATLLISCALGNENLPTDIRTGAPGMAAPEIVCCGAPLPDHEVRVISDAGKPQAPGEVGEICFRGPSVAKGYYRDETATRETFGGGWLKTGDLGYIKDGQLFITGRKKDLLILNGRNWDPQRVEWILDELPDVRKGNVIAFSVPGNSTEELVVALEARVRSKEEIEQLQSLAWQKLSDELQLSARAIVVLPPGSLPKTSSGKLQRQKARALYLEGELGRSRNRVSADAQRWVLAKHMTLAWVGRGRNWASQFVDRFAPPAVSDLWMGTSRFGRRLGRFWSRVEPRLEE